MIQDNSQKKNQFGKSLKVLDVSKVCMDRIHGNEERSIPTPDNLEVYPNQPLILKNQKTSCLALVSKDGKRIRKIDEEVSFFNISGRNKEQKLLMNILRDPEIRCVVVTGPAGTGKAQPLDADILTKEGWKQMGDINPGDQVAGPDGTFSEVKDTYPQGKKDIFKVTFSDGSSTKCTKDHLWKTQSGWEKYEYREGSVKSLKDIMETNHERDNHFIPMSDPVDFAEKDLPLDPYLLGVLIGDGSLKNNFRISSGDDSVINKCDEKFIPDGYLTSSVEQRLALLRGLMDADGTTDKRKGQVHLTTVSPELRDDVTELVQSLGGTAPIRDKTPNNGEKKKGKASYNINIKLPSDINPFSLPRKANHVSPKTKCTPTRSIENIEYVGTENAQCIKVDRDDGLYITDDYIVTHNTTVLGSYLLQEVLERHNYEKMILSKPLEIVTRTRYWGTVPGDEDEKFDPFLKSYQIMFEDMVGKKGTSYIEKAMDKGIIDFLPLELMRGASLKDCLCWYDEAQNLNFHECNSLGSRIDDDGGSKLILSGDLNQRDRNIDRHNTGIMEMVQSPVFLNSPLTAHVNLVQNERGEVSQLFHDIFDEDERE